MARTTSTEVKMETVEKIGIVSDNGRSSLELRVTKVNDGEEKYDIRTWWTDDKNCERYNKGIRLTEDELLKLGEIINGMFEEE